MEKVRQAIRAIPDFPKPGIMFRDITPLLESPAAFTAAMDAIEARYRDANLDRIVAIESRGFLFGAALAQRLNVGLALVRKPGKLPYEKVSKEYALEYGTDKIEMHVDAVRPGQRCLIIDDLLATGGTAAAACDLVRGQGGNIIECAFIIELTGLPGRTRLAPTPAFALLQFPA